MPLPTLPEGETLSTQTPSLFAVSFLLREMMLSVAASSIPHVGRMAFHVPLCSIMIAATASLL